MNYPALLGGIAAIAAVLALWALGGMRRRSRCTQLPLPGTGDAADAQKDPLLRPDQLAGADGSPLEEGGT